MRFLVLIVCSVLALISSPVHSDALTAQHKLQRLSSRLSAEAYGSLADASSVTATAVDSDYSRCNTGSGSAAACAAVPGLSPGVSCIYGAFPPAPGSTSPILSCLPNSQTVGTYNGVPKLCVSCQVATDPMQCSHPALRGTCQWSGTSCVNIPTQAAVVASFCGQKDGQAVDSDYSRCYTGSSSATACAAVTGLSTGVSCIYGAFPAPGSTTPMLSCLPNLPTSQTVGTYNGVPKLCVSCQVATDTMQCSHPALRGTCQWSGTSCVNIPTQATGVPSFCQH